MRFESFLLGVCLAASASEAVAGPLLGSVTQDADSVCAGESLQVDVQLAPEHADTAAVWIDGVPGRHRVLQLTGREGPRRIEVRARGRDGRIETRTLQAKVRVCGEQPPPELRVSMSVDHPHTVHFVAHGPEGVRYRWDFGDGTSQETRHRAVSHTYAVEDLDWQADATPFLVGVTVILGSGPPLKAEKTVSLRSLYAANSRMGLIQPPIEYGPRVGKDPVSVRIQNVEVSDGLQLEAYRVFWQPCASGENETEAQGGPLAVGIPPRGQRTIALGFHGTTSNSVQSEVLRLPTPPRSACGAAIYLTGHTAPSGKTVEVPIYLELAVSPERVSPVMDVAIAAVLKTVFDQGLASRPDRMTEEELFQLVREGRVSWPSAEEIAARNQQAAHLALLTAAPELEDRCDPGTVLDPPVPGWECRATDSFTEVSSYIANGRAGDVILSAACGQIGGLLRAINPAQQYSHSGVFTANYDSIRHSTAAEERFGDQEHFWDGTNGILDDVLRYAEPGVITQSVVEGYRGGGWRDPRTGKVHTIVGFSDLVSRCPGDRGLIYPEIVTGAIGARRETLQRIARHASVTYGHYRFFAYSDASIALDPAYNVPGTERIATVCSSFIWAAAQRAGIQGLEGPQLERGDLEGGAQLPTTSDDGLYHYSESERRAAGAFLYDELYDKAYEEAGFWGRLLTDAPDNLATQVANCFANDGCSPRAADRNEERFRNPGVGVAVSPDNILFWDAPYGRREPAAYRGAEMRRLYAWAPPKDWGALEGIVVDHSGLPVVNATVRLAGFEQEVTTGVEGRFRFEAVPGGLLEVEASHWVGEQLLRGRAEATIAPDQVARVLIQLEGPRDQHRILIVSGEMEINDADWPDGDEREIVPVLLALNLSPGQPNGTARFEHCTGNEVRVELEVQANWRPSGIDATLRASLFEGTNCNAEDEERRHDELVELARGESKRVAFEMRNGGDWTKLDLELTNQVQH